MLAVRFRAPRLLSRGLATVAKPASSPSLHWPAVVRPSAGEIKNARLDERSLEKAVRHIHQDGLVVIEDVVPHEDIDQLNTKMVQDARVLQDMGDKGPFNYNQGNLQQDAPPVAEFFYPSIFTSKNKSLAQFGWNRASSSNISSSYRPYCHPNHFGRSWTSAQMDILLCQRSHASPPRSIPPASAGAFRRRLCSPGASLCSRCQRSTRNDDS